jgi:hypothetical protein
LAPVSLLLTSPDVAWRHGQETTCNLFEYSTQAACNADAANSGGTFVGQVSTTSSPCLANLFNQGSGFRVAVASATSGSCTPSGSPTKTPASWTTSVKLCRATSVGAGCASGNVCVKKSANHCAVADEGSQACPAGYSRYGTDRWFTGFDDTRACGPCGCGAQTPGDCTRDVNDNPVTMPVLFGTSTTCGAGAHTAARINGKSCAINYDCGSAGWPQLSSVPSFRRPSCPGISTPSGALTPTSEHTVCCQ